MDKYLTYSVVERKDPQNPEMGGKVLCTGSSSRRGGHQGIVAENTADVYGDACGRDGGAYSSGGCGVRLALER